MSVFLQRPPADWVASNALAFAIRDSFPVSEGHTLVVPKREFAAWFEATPAERVALFELVDVVKAKLDQGPRRPDGYNIGVNVGAAAGQTVMHLHVHVIPRFDGDMEDPRGGVRYCIPHKGNYLKATIKPLARGGAEDPFLGHLVPLFATATDLAIIAAFVQDSGLDLLKEHVLSALERGARVRLLTGDYLAITQVEALERLLEWSEFDAIQTGESKTSGRFEAQVIETAKLPGGTRSFHPKSWRFEGPGLAVAFVGSSNVSLAALKTGIEWNLRVEKSHDLRAWEDIVRGFDELWKLSVPLSTEWIADYKLRAKRAPAPLPLGEVEPDLRPPPMPHEIQQAALERLEQSRAEQRSRALVVLATGLGKTWLAVWDIAAYARQLGRWPRVLFVAHRSEILGQAAETFHRLCRRDHPEVRVSWFIGERGDLDGDVVLASVQKLSLPDNLARLRPDSFDYVVVDEVHHADAPSYRKILARLSPRFLLGLTATPDRADQGDVLGLFDDNLAFRADLGEGIAARKLVPFAYFGIKDDVDYRAANIPWRGGRFDVEALERNVVTEQRMRQLWKAWGEHPGTRTLVFCCSIRHAEYARDWLRKQGLRVEAVFSQPGSADRAAALDGLKAGTLDALCAVDLFNEGVDVPDIDRVVMLRPTESATLFIQQLGRGLRTSPGKAQLTVIDFVGNHRVFLDRVRTLLSLAGSKTSLDSFLRRSVTEPDLPAGCSLELELEAIDLLAKLLPTGKSLVERMYRELHQARGERPTAGELYRMGYLPSTLRLAHGSWLDFVESEGHLTDDLLAAFAAGRQWFRDLEITPMTKCFKMVTLEALLEADALATGMALFELASQCHALVVRSPELLADVEGVKELPDPRNPEPSAWQAYWRKNPIEAWTAGSAKKGRAWFAVDGERLVSSLPIPAGLEGAFAELTRELVDYRLAVYRARRSGASGAAAFECKLTWNKRDPILKLPARGEADGLPWGDTDVRLDDGRIWRFRFGKEYCNVAHPVGSDRNQLPDLTRRWFGPQAGHPGTSFHVRFARAPEGWWIEPIGARVIPLPKRGRVIAYPSLRVAAGRAGSTGQDSAEAEQVRLPVARPETSVFAVRADGDSMDGGANPIRDGDWLIMRWARAEGVGHVAGRVALVQAPDGASGYTYQIKRLVRAGSGFVLRSDNPDVPELPVGEQAAALAVLESVVRPESLAPPVGTQLDDGEIAAAFGLPQAPRTTGREEGQLFIVMAGARAWRAPDRLELDLADRRPGETAFVLLRTAEGARWRYCGVARWQKDEGLWALPEFDYPTWKEVNGGRNCSRTLPRAAQKRALALAARIVATPGLVVGDSGRRCEIVGPASNGGVRVRGEAGAFAERTVTVTDLGWALQAEDDVRHAGGVLDEARVNRLRYIEGTPKASTRWIDTKWALTLLDQRG